MPETYTELEQRISSSEADAILARWEFGRLLLVERAANGGKQLPPGRLDAVCAEVDRSKREIQLRMQFAGQCHDEDEVRNVLRTFGSWYAITQDFLPEHQPEPPAPPAPQPPSGPTTTFKDLIPDPPTPQPPGPVPEPQPVVPIPQQTDEQKEHSKTSYTVERLLEACQKFADAVDHALLHAGQLPEDRESLKQAAQLSGEAQQHLLTYIETGQTELSDLLSGGAS